MRYYFNIIENTVNGENRSVPSAYDDRDSAMAKYHKTVGTDIASEQIIGYVAMVFDSKGGIVALDVWGTMEKYVAPVVPEEATEE